jgi:hypothetical protein
LKPKVSIRVLIGIVLSLAVVFLTFYLATIVDGGVSPVFALLGIAVIWLALFWDKRDRSGRGGGSMGDCD